MLIPIVCNVITSLKRIYLKLVLYQVCVSKDKTVKKIRPTNKAKVFFYSET